MTKQQKSKYSSVPAAALCLGLGEPGAAVAEFAEEGKTPKLNMTIYSGGIIPDHYFWDNLILDLEGMSVPKKKFPILENHDRSKKIAFHEGLPLTDKGLRVNPDKTRFVSTAESQQFQQLSAEGFPYEASARVRPKVIERIREGSFAEANGIKLKGPGTIFRKWDLVEGSVCVFGYDRNTESAAAFSADTVELDCTVLGDEFHDNHNQGVATKMDRETLLKEHPDLVKQIQAEAVAAAEKEMETKFSEPIQAIEGTVTKLQGTVEAQNQTIQDLHDKNLKLERENTLRAEAEMTAKADGKWAAALSKSDVPEHLHVKARIHVQHDQFIDKETGECDWTKFSEAVAQEIKYWEASLSKGASSVQGGGYPGRHGGEEGHGLSETELQEEDAWVEEMAALAQDEGGEA